jgi:hypothetical protein
VAKRAAEDQIELLIEDIEMLLDAGVLIAAAEDIIACLET